jgi:anti-sigma B factor antagonist
MDDKFGTEVIHLDGDAVLMVTGDVDASTAPKLHEACLQLTSITDRLVLDLSSVTFMDSSGLRVLIQIHEREGTSSMTVRNAPNQVRRLLEITALAEWLLDPLSSPAECGAHEIPGPLTERKLTKGPVTGVA